LRFSDKKVFVGKPNQILGKKLANVRPGEDFEMITSESAGIKVELSVPYEEISNSAELLNRYRYIHKLHMCGCF
jgi:hypothetical protein